MSADDLCFRDHALLWLLLKSVFLSFAWNSLPWLVAKPFYLQEETVQRPQVFSQIKDQMLGLICKAFQFIPVTAVASSTDQP